MVPFLEDPGRSRHKKESSGRQGEADQQKKLYQHKNRHTERDMTTRYHEPRMKRDNIYRHSDKGERERERGNKNTFLCAARQAAARLAQEPHGQKRYYGPRRAGTSHPEVKGLTLIQLS